MYAVTNDIPLPASAGNLRKYPKLETVGESFLVPFRPDVTVDYLQRLVCSTMGARGRRLGHKYTTSRTEEGIRVWRVA
jgi:hypothetical protein